MNDIKYWIKMKKQFDEIEEEIEDSMVWRGMNRIITIQRDRTVP